MSLIAPLKNPRSGVALALGILAWANLPGHAANALQFSGAGWMQYGSITTSSDTVAGDDPTGRPLINLGAQFALTANPSEKLRIEIGLGAAAGHFLAANRNRQGGYAPFEVGPYVSNGNFKYSLWDEEHAKLSFRGGLFPFDYNPDAQNLGLYLLRGPVYPGYVLSGFETKYVLPVANTFGFNLHHKSGGFSHDFLFLFETDFFPYWDMSPAYVASYATKAFRIGAGVNFYHLIPIDKQLTTDKTKIYVDTVPAVDDTTVISYQGTKVMATAAIDFKALFSAGGEDGIFGAEDLKLYGEAALIGFDNGSAHKALYGTYANRMPIMVGFNFPTFKILDRLSLEVESYKAKFKDDINGYNAYGKPTPIPFGRLDTAYTEDDIKWSLYGSKVIKSHIKISVQAASDHYRPGIFKGYGDNNPPARQAIFYKPSEWYWVTKVAYFF
ncbi:MAG: hypothetical protein M3Y08_08795 [Fibrobacterota bacterium]|nr:hypothetical protein [Fibrobacterota bacterium]